MAQRKGRHARRVGRTDRSAGRCRLVRDAAPSARVRTELMRLCAYYLQHVKHRNEPADAVARFHLGNGARMERLNWLADTSKTGMARSAGLMVNYVYRLKDIERNHEAYAKEQQVVASAGLSLLARGRACSRA